jgi:hypothetical protein
VIRQAIKELIDLQAWHLAAIDEGVKEADAGKLIPHPRVDPDALVLLHVLHGSAGPGSYIYNRI